MKSYPTQPTILLSLFLSIFFLITPETSKAENSGPFVTKIRVTGNTLIDPYYLDDYLNLGNGLTMTPQMMDLAVSELKANYNYHGFPFIDAYSTLKVKNGIMTLKVDEKNEYQWGRPRAERAVLKQAFLHNITLKESRKQEIIETLVKGYQKQRDVEEIVAGFLVKKQRQRIEEVESQKKAVMRERVAEKVKEFQTLNKNLEAQEIRRIEEMRVRIEAAAVKKVDEFATENLKMVSEEYTDLDEFLDNAIFEETLNPGL
jgi:hypothetical protein